MVMLTSLKRLSLEVSRINRSSRIFVKFSRLQTHYPNSPCLSVFGSMEYKMLTDLNGAKLVSSAQSEIMKEKRKCSQSKTDQRSGRTQKRQHNKDRYKTFRGNKQEGQGFADRRKNKMIHDYNKMVRKEQKKKEGVKVSIQSIDDEGTTLKHVSPQSDISHNSEQTSKQTKISSVDKAQLNWLKKQKEIDQDRKEQEKIQKESAEALARYRKKKKIKHKKLCVKNYKGQPNMASQMEVLLGKIEAQNKS